MSRLTFRPLEPALMDALGEVLRGSWGLGCWCMHPRLTDAQTRQLPGKGSRNEARRRAMTKVAGRRRAPYAGKHGAPAVEAYPRAGKGRVGDDSAYFGTEPLFRRAGFRTVREGLGERVARVAMRIKATRARAAPSPSGKRG